MPHEDGATEKNDEVDQAVILLPRKAVDGANDSDRGDRKNHGEVDEGEAEILEVPDVEGKKQRDG